MLKKIIEQVRMKRSEATAIGQSPMHTTDAFSTIGSKQLVYATRNVAHHTVVPRAHAASSE